MPHALTVMDGLFDELLEALPEPGTPVEIATSIDGAANMLAGDYHSVVLSPRFGIVGYLITAYTLMKDTNGRVTGEQAVRLFVNARHVVSLGWAPPDSAQPAAVAAGPEPLPSVTVTAVPSQPGVFLNTSDGLDDDGKRVIEDLRDVVRERVAHAWKAS